MGTSAKVVVLGGRPGLAQEAVARVEDLERRWSRFRSDSELVRLNAAPSGVAVLVSSELFRLVVRAVQGWRLTGGRYDPTVLDAVVANGYDRTFTMIPDDRSEIERSPQRAPGCGAIELDTGLRSITLPAGVGIDPGGIGKGLAADIVADEAIAQGADGVLVDIGGDIRVAGAGPHDGAWIVDVNHPLRPDDALLHLALRDAGIATSTSLRRRWQINGEARHHIVDPMTGRPTSNPLVTVSALAGAAWWAEVVTKAIMVAGRVDVIHDLDGIDGVSVLAVDAAGECTGTPDLLELLVPEHVASA